jgi:hypothetical protein
MQIGKSPWRIALSSWLIYYVFQNLFLLLGLNGKDTQNDQPVY